VDRIGQPSRRGTRPYVALRFYKREAGKGVAARFLSDFERVISLLEAYPEIGTPTNEHRRSYSLTGFRYSVIYRHVEAGIRGLVKDPVRRIVREELAASS
jgi:plasmid stabilization system protein ParE